MIRILIEMPDGETRELDTIPDETHDPAELSRRLRLIADRFDAFTALKRAVGDIFGDLDLGGEAAA